MVQLTDDERRALRGTLVLNCVDSFRQAVLLGKLQTLNFLIHAVLAQSLAKPDMSQAKLTSEIAHALDIGSVPLLVDNPEALTALNDLALQALTLPIPDP